MSFGWFNSRQAAEVGAALADQFAPPTASQSITRSKKNPAQREGAAALPELLRRAERETRALGLNFRSEEHTSELQSQSNIVCRLLLEKKKNIKTTDIITRIKRD